MQNEKLNNFKLKEISTKYQLTKEKTRSKTSALKKRIDSLSGA
jgi:hypothetical protein